MKLGKEGVGWMKKSRALGRPVEGEWNSPSYGDAVSGLPDEEDTDWKLEELRK